MALGISGAGWLAISGLVSAAAGGVQAEQSNSAQRRGLRRQGQAQQRAEANAASQRRESQVQQRRANRKQADIGGILAGELGQGGLGSTLLTGPQGVASDRLRLGKGTTLLGG